MVRRLLFFVSLCFPVLTAQAANRPVSGWVEKVKISPSGLLIHAKLDTGADYSSLNASDLREFEKGGKPWVRFTVESRFGEKQVIESAIRRIALIKRKGGKHESRPVVRIGICLGTTFMEADVNLVNRTNFDYQMLIGRNFLAGNVLVDSASTLTLEPQCSAERFH